MPWSKKRGHADCAAGEIAVVKDEDDTVAGCHATEDEADAQLAALYAQEDDDTAAHADELAAEITPTAEAPSSIAWEGVIAVEGRPTGDRREFSPGALEFAPMPLPLKWQPAEGDGHAGSVVAGRIDSVVREGYQIRARGVFDAEGEHGAEALRLVRGGYLKGVSVDLDDIDDADVELVFPESSEDDGVDDETLFAAPELMRFHHARLRAATLTPMPAFVEAEIQLVDETTTLEVEPEPSLAASAVHDSTTSTATWDGPANDRRLPTVMPNRQARAAYAYVAPEHARDDLVPIGSTGFLHHEVTEVGSVGAANVAACAAGLGVLSGGRGGSRLSEVDRRGVYDHLAAHLRAAGRAVPDFEPEPLTAAAVLQDQRPSAAWFTDPRLDGPTPITVGEDGRVFGHAATWSTCHIGFSDECISPPHESDHPYFRTGEVLTSEGERVAVGQITLGTGHAPLSLGAAPAAEHYDHTGTAVADVAVGNDDFGIWVAGVVRPSVETARVRELQAAGQVSGDWRRIGGQLRLVGLLAVNVPGFPVPRQRARVASGVPTTLVAAGRVRGDAHLPGDVREALRAGMQAVAAAVGRTPEARRAELISRVRG